MVNPTDDATTLAQTLLGSGLTLINATYTGSASSAGAYVDGPLSIQNGIVLTTGQATDVPEDQELRASTGYKSVTNHPLCTGITDGSFYDFTLLTMYVAFDTASDNQLSTQFVFASEEYPGFVGQEFNDALGVYFDGVQHALDGRGQAVAINNVFFKDEAVVKDTGTVFNGATPLLNLRSPGLPQAEAHRIDMIVCDNGDNIYGKASRKKCSLVLRS